jgi:broad specificity phosphatase PhoE
MARVTLVRHAQASFLEPNYDQLCATGEVQARLLGEYWARRGLGFRRAWSGPCARQVQTARIVEEAYRAMGRDFPELEIMNEFDEYPGDVVLRQGLPQLLESSKDVRRAHKRFQDCKDSTEQRRIFQKMFELVIGKWVSGDVTVAGVESWQDFCTRVGCGLAKMANGATAGGNLVVFTSGGPIAVAMRRALHLSHADTLQMTWMSRNASFSEFLSSADRFTLSTFNATPHLDDESLLTYR